MVTFLEFLLTLKNGRRPIWVIFKYMGFWSSVIVSVLFQWFGLIIPDELVKTFPLVGMLGIILSFLNLSSIYYFMEKSLPKMPNLFNLCVWTQTFSVILWVCFFIFSILIQIIPLPQVVCIFFLCYSLFSFVSALSQLHMLSRYVTRRENHD